MVCYQDLDCCGKDLLAWTDGYQPWCGKLTGDPGPDDRAAAALPMDTGASAS
jgi:hypothetical protein